jgi:Transcriptional regulator/sugar kinase
MRIGVDVGGTKIEIIALDNNGRTIVRRRMATPSADYAGTVRAIVNLVVEAQRRLEKLRASASRRRAQSRRRRT